MEEFEAQSQPPAPQELEQAETAPQAGENYVDEIVAPELIEALPELPAFTPGQLADEVSESNIKVVWRGGVPGRVLLAVALSVVINTAMGLGFFLAIYGFFIAPKSTHREFGAYVTLPEDIEDGGSPGGVGKAGDPNVIADTKAPPSLDKIFSEKPSADLLGPVDMAGAEAFSSIESGEKLTLIAVGTGANPRVPGKPKGGGQANGGKSGGGSGSSSGAGLGGSGTGSGTGNGDGADLGMSMDTQVRILDGPKMVIPGAYLNGTVKLDNPPLIRVWVLANNRVGRVELVKSSGDATFDAIVVEHYRRQKYLAATVDGEPVEKYIDVSYELGGMGKKIMRGGSARRGNS